MRVEEWNPNVMDETFENIAIDRLVEAAEVVASAARRGCPVGTVSRPMYRRGAYAGQPWTARDAGQLKKSIRVVRRKTKSGKALTKKRNVRVYAGHSRPFMRNALNGSIPAMRSIVGAR
jgi:hypothetical protein